MHFKLSRKASFKVRILTLLQAFLIAGLVSGIPLSNPDQEIIADDCEPIPDDDLVPYIEPLLGFLHEGTSSSTLAASLSYTPYTTIPASGTAQETVGVENNPPPSTHTNFLTTTLPPSPSYTYTKFLTTTLPPSSPSSSTTSSSTSSSSTTSSSTSTSSTSTSSTSTSSTSTSSTTSSSTSSTTSTSPTPPGCIGTSSMLIGNRYSIPDHVCAGSDGSGHSDIFTCGSNTWLFSVFAPGGTPHSNGKAANDQDGWETWSGGGCFCNNGNFCCNRGASTCIPVGVSGWDNWRNGPGADEIQAFKNQGGQCSCNG